MSDKSPLFVSAADPLGERSRRNAAVRARVDPLQCSETCNRTSLLQPVSTQSQWADPWNLGF